MKLEKNKLYYHRDKTIGDWILVEVLNFFEEEDKIVVEFKKIKNSCLEPYTEDIYDICDYGSWDDLYNYGFRPFEKEVGYDFTTHSLRLEV